jgi:hypothetical protein
MFVPVGQRPAITSTSSTGRGVHGSAGDVARTGFNFAAHREDYDQYASLPSWARTTLEKHSTDRRDHRYTLRQFETAGTHDPVCFIYENRKELITCSKALSYSKKSRSGATPTK